jgi:hypothetical protein
MTDKPDRQTTTPSALTNEERWLLSLIAARLADVCIHLGLREGVFDLRRAAQAVEPREPEKAA